MLFYNSEIRDFLGKMESQYNCLLEQDYTPNKPFKFFFRDDLPELLGKIERIIEKRTDLILKK